jgi:hypothetical protein
MSYYYAGANATERMGPCDIEHLIQLYKSNLINEETLVWTEGQVNWEPLLSNKIGPVVMGTSKQFVEYDVDNDDEEDEDDNLSLSNDESRISEVLEYQSLLNKVCSEGVDDLSVGTTDELVYEEEFMEGPPPLMKGQLLKMASGLIKNWRNRFFILEKGTLIYCEPAHLKLRGRYNLEGLLVMDLEDTSGNDSPETIRLYSATRPDICLIASSVALRKRWVDAIEKHIKYANSLALDKRQPHQTSSPSPTTLSKHNSVRKITIIEQGEDGLAFRKDENRNSIGGGDQARLSVVQQRGVRSDTVLSTRTAPSPENTFDGRGVRSNTTTTACNNSGNSNSAVVDTAINTHINSASSTPSNLTDNKSGAVAVRPSNISGRSSNSNEIPAVCEGWLQKQGNELFICVE